MKVTHVCLVACWKTKCGLTVNIEGLAADLGFQEGELTGWNMNRYLIVLLSWHRNPVNVYLDPLWMRTSLSKQL